MTGSDPTFSGRIGEDVDLYLNQCRVKWLGRSLCDSDFNLAIATTTLGGLRDAAERYAKTLKKEDKKDWETLHNLLQKKFAEREDPNQDTVALRKISRLVQGRDETTRKYLERIRDLEVQLPAGPHWQGLLTGGAVEGLRNEMTKKVLMGHLESRKADDAFTMDDVTRMALSLEDGKPQETVAGGGAKSAEELLAESIRTQTEWMQDCASSQQTTWDAVLKRIADLEKRERVKRAVDDDMAKQPQAAERQKRCYRCGSTSHLVPRCPLPPPNEEPTKPPEILKNQRQPAAPTTPSSGSTAVAGTVSYVDVDDPSMDSWNHRTTGAHTVSLSYTDNKTVAKELNRLYALGDKRRHEEAFDSTSERPRRKQPKTRKKRGGPAERRHVKAIEGVDSLDFHQLLNSQTVEISLAQLMDISPMARVQVGRLLKLQPKRKKKETDREPEREQEETQAQPRETRSRKGKEPMREDQSGTEPSAGPSRGAGRKGMSAALGVYAVRDSDVEHDDFMQPQHPEAITLFHTSGVMQAMTRDNAICAAESDQFLIDGGCSGNIIPRPVVERMNARVTKVPPMRGELADGAPAVFDSIVWLMLEISGCTRAIAALVAEGQPHFTLLLGRHWMHSVDLIGQYRTSTYSLMADSGKRQDLVKSNRFPTPKKGVKIHADTYNWISAGATSASSGGESSRSSGSSQDSDWEDDYNTDPEEVIEDLRVIEEEFAAEPGDTSSADGDDEESVGSEN